MRRRLVLVGGGLANSLIAFRLGSVRPDVDLVVLERGDRLGGNHLWCFHDGDLTDEQRDWTAPLVERSWPGYEVRFPELRRRLDGGYHAVTSSRLHRVVGAALGDRVRYGADVSRITAHEVQLSDGSVVDADAVVDGRGWVDHPSLAIAYQKFVGRTFELEADHGLAEPLLMDATVEQRDGFRFIYTLPMSESSLLIEDTRYSDTPDLDRDGMRTEIARYAESRGWKIRETTREEEGILPIVLDGDPDAFWKAGPHAVPRSGLRAALFQPVTGYSWPEAVRLADALPEGPPLTSEELFPWIRRRSLARWRDDRFLRMLNRMLFRAAQPDRRFRVLERFYRLPAPLIRRFYAGVPTLADRLRILTGKPPVPLGRALSACFSRRGPSRRSLPKSYTGGDGEGTGPLPGVERGEK